MLPTRTSTLMKMHQLPGKGLELGLTLTLTLTLKGQIKIQDDLDAITDMVIIHPSRQPGNTRCLLFIPHYPEKGFYGYSHAKRFL